MSHIDDAREALKAGGEFDTSRFANGIMSGEVLGTFLAAFTLIAEEQRTANLLEARKQRVDLYDDPAAREIAERLNIRRFNDNSVAF